MNLTGKVFMVDADKRLAHIEIESKDISFGAYPMFYTAHNYRLTPGDLVETTPFKKNFEGRHYVELVQVKERYKQPEWLYEHGEHVTGTFHDGKFHNEKFIVLNFDFVREAAYDFWCYVRSVDTGEEYDAIAPKVKGQPFELVTYEVIS